MNTPKGQEFQEFAEQLKLVYHFAFTHHLMDQMSHTLDSAEHSIYLIPTINLI
ncbi:hypothetical protein PtB15_4B623 [Puccinia triticina]|nr:hypothetical protein PtB15_4B623 [Puccinia triticina]